MPEVPVLTGSEIKSKTMYPKLASRGLPACTCPSGQAPLPPSNPGLGNNWWWALTKEGLVDARSVGRLQCLQARARLCADAQEEDAARVPWIFPLLFCLGRGRRDGVRALSLGARIRSANYTTHVPVTTCGYVRTCAAKSFQRIMRPNPRGQSMELIYGCRKGGRRGLVSLGGCGSWRQRLASAWEMRHGTNEISKMPIPGQGRLQGLSSGSVRRCAPLRLFHISAHIPRDKEE